MRDAISVTRTAFQLSLMRERIAKRLKLAAVDQWVTKDVMHVVDETVRHIQEDAFDPDDPEG